jgi:hypothetical protein
MKELVDSCWDATSAARNTIKVKPTKPATEFGETYYVSFMLNIDTKTHEELVEEAEQHRPPQNVLRDYLRFAFKVCFQDEVEADAA